MIQFEKINVESIEKLRTYYKNCDYQLCEYSAGTKIMWNEYLHSEYAEVAGCLIVRNTINGSVQFDYPVPREEGNVEEALTAIENDCRDRGQKLIISVVPENKVGGLVMRYPRTKIINERAWKDYLYHVSDLAQFAGRRYSGQRNHINKFRKNFPDVLFRELTSEDADSICLFWKDYESEFPKDSDMAKNELRSAKKMFELMDRDCFLTGGLFDGKRLIALSMAEKSGKTLIIHIEKALYSYEGAYPTLVQKFSDYFGKECLYINREDDARDRGLRISKLQYLPCMLGSKVYVEVGTELDDLKKEPSIDTERLELTPFTADDRREYNRLCLDDDRNRWWGYDYRDDLKEELTEDYFLNVIKEDFKARRAVNFAIRINGKFIGETILYNFNFHSCAELGCRILPEYAGKGYGTEAFAATAEWALYKLGIEKVIAKCYHENMASQRMLSSCMRAISKDETFCYFEKII